MTQSEMDQVKGYIFDIQRYSIHDGPGIRSTIFFKGCPLRCTWCENPESQKQSSQLLYIKHLCRRCHKCVEVCSNQANRVLPDGSLEVDRKLCQACGRCVEICPLEARQIFGKLMSVDEVMDVVKRDALFYRNSGGGVTASGGEPTAQPAFLISLFKECQKLGFHTTLDTCGFVKWEVLKPILEYVNLVLFDIKQTDPEVHQQLTGVNNQLILENAKKIVAAGVPLIVRVPLIPGFNDSEEDIRALAQFALELDGQQEVNLLPYHKFGSEKYDSLGMKYELDNLEPYTEEEIGLHVDLIKSYGLRVEIV
jgi:glycyl-radical enzyme activating protein